MSFFFTCWVVVLFFVSKNSKNHLQTRFVAKGPWVNARNATTLGVASAPRAGAGIGTENMVLTTKEALPSFHSNSLSIWQGVIKIIKVWGVIESRAHVLVVLRNSPPHKKNVRVGVIFHGACMYDIRSKLEHPEIFGGFPLFFFMDQCSVTRFHGPHGRLSSIWGFRAESRNHFFRVKCCWSLHKVSDFLSVFEILTPPNN